MNISADKRAVLNIISKDDWMNHTLDKVKELDLSDWWIGAGFVRNKVWDYLHDFSTRTALEDVDVIYFDSNKNEKKFDIEIENQLREIDNSINWSVKNQARMHLKNGDPPYLSAEDALSKWTETATSIGVKKDRNGNLKLSCPHGVADLLNLIIRPTPFIRQDINIYYNRLEKKQWHKKWHKLHYILI